jgi:DNA-binding IclR family transcriptional regulator
MAHWTFLTNHTQVLLCIARNPRLTAKEIAAQVGITERAVQRLLDDLARAGYISRTRDGRRNVYEIHPELPMRHPAQHGYAIRDLLNVLVPTDAADQDEPSATAHPESPERVL